MGNQLKQTLATRWEKLTKLEKTIILNEVKRHFPIQYKNLHMGSLPFVSLDDAYTAVGSPVNLYPITDYDGWEKTTALRVKLIP